jgi:hypothetical protein
LTDRFTARVAPPGGLVNAQGDGAIPLGENCYRLLTNNNCEHFREWCLRGKARGRRALLATLRLIAQPPCQLLGRVQAKDEPLNRPVEVRHRAARGCGGRRVGVGGRLLALMPCVMTYVSSWRTTGPIRSQP